MLYHGESCSSVVCLVGLCIFGVFNCGLLSSCRCVCVWRCLAWHI